MGIWAQYDELARKNQELDKYWSQQMEASTTVTLQTTEAGTDEMTFSEMRRMVQVLGHQPGLDEKSEGQFGDHREGGGDALMPCGWNSLTGYCCTWSQSWLRPRAEGQHQAQEYKALLNIKVKLEAEIATCWKQGRTSFLVMP